MKKLTTAINYLLVQPDELPPAEQALVQKAIDATNNSYARYSNFHVGAACLLENGNVVIGANQENAAFPSGLCAERTAIFAARNVNGLLKSPISPCGACRQVVLEIEDRYQRPVRILLYGTEGIYVFESIKDLLPFSFVDANMH